MVEAGDSAAHAHAMYDQSVTIVVLVAAVVAVAASLVLAIVLVADAGPAAGRDRQRGPPDRRGRLRGAGPARGPRRAPSLADSFNQMAASLERQEAMRRDFIANAAHELRTPLTNLQGYLEALRDGVITADRATYESLWDEAERLVRLSRSLDALAEGDAAGPAGAGRAGPRRRRSAAPSSSPSPRLERAGLSVVVDVPRAPARAGQRGPPRPGAREPPVQRRARTRPPAARSRSAPSGGPADLLVSIENSGEGIPPEDLDRVFERFYRVEKSRDRARGGAGIGLAIVKQLVEVGRRPGRRGVGVRHHAVLVQPAGLTQRGADVAVDHLAAPRGFEFEGGRSAPSSASSRLQVVHLDLKCLDLKRPATRYCSRYLDVKRVDVELLDVE